MTAIQEQDSALVLNGLNLMQTEPDPDTGAMIHVLGEDAEWGDAEAAIASIQSQLFDGDLERIDRFGNRSASLPLVLEVPEGCADPGDALARAAAQLDMACQFSGWTTLEYTPPLAGGEVCVLEVTTAFVQTKFDDLEEMEYGCRYVTLTFHARPWTRPTEPVTIDAPPVVGSSSTTVDDGSSTTGWSLVEGTPAPTTNLEPDPNVTGLGGWAGTVSGQTTTYTGGVVRMTAPASAKQVGIESDPYTVVAGRFYEFGTGLSLEAWSGTRPASTMRVTWYSDAGATAQVGTPTVVTLSGLSSSAKSFATPVLEAPVGAIRARIAVTVGTGPGGIALLHGRWANECTDGEDIYLGHFYGDTVDTAAVAFAWTGAADASTSTATWTAASLLVYSGAVFGTVYGRTSATIRRAGSIDMSTLTYLRVRGKTLNGTAIEVADNGGDPLTPVSFWLNSGTGEYDALYHRPEGFTALDVRAVGRTDVPARAQTYAIAVDSVVITDNPFGTGKVQVRQVQIHGSQRTELSLSVLGLDGAGTGTVALGEQVLVHTAAKGSESQAKFLAVRAAAGESGTADATATTGVYTALGDTASPTDWSFPASALLPGNYLVVARLRVPSLPSTSTLSFRGYIDPTGGAATAWDPRTGWKTAPVTAGALPDQWPTLEVDEWAMVPLGLLRLPAADVEDPDATVGIQLARQSATIHLDDVFLCNADVGQTSILLAGGCSAVRLDAATVDRPQPSAWLGDADGAMIADPGRWIGEQHLAAPGLLQVSTVTPGCDSSRVSGRYYPRNNFYVARVEA